MAGNVTRVPGLEDPGSGPEIKCRVRVWTRIPLTALVHTTLTSQQKLRLDEFKKGSKHCM